MAFIGSMALRSSAFSLLLKCSSSGTRNSDSCMLFAAFLYRSRVFVLFTYLVDVPVCRVPVLLVSVRFALITDGTVGIVELSLFTFTLFLVDLGPRDDGGSGFDPSDRIELDLDGDSSWSSGAGFGTSFLFLVGSLASSMRLLVASRVASSLLYRASDSVSLRIECVSGCRWLLDARLEDVLVTGIITRFNWSIVSWCIVRGYTMLS